MTALFTAKAIPNAGYSFFVNLSPIKINIMFRIITCVVIVFSLVALKSRAQEKPKKINYKNEGYIKAQIINYNVDGCGFLIELCDKTKSKFAPEKLADNFKKDKQKIWIKYAVVKKQPLSTCMTGKLVEVLDIQKR